MVSEEKKKFEANVERNQGSESMLVRILLRVEFISLYFYY